MSIHNPESENKTTGQVPHSGVHHGEKPVEEFDTPLRDPVEQGKISEWPEAVDPRVAKQAERNRNLKRNLLISGGVLAVSAVVSLAIVNGASHGSEKTEPRQEPGTSAAANPTQTTQEKAFPKNTAQEYFADEHMTREKATAPMILTADQLSKWDSGDQTAQNDVASDVLTPRLETAISDIQQAELRGDTADISYLSSDPGVYTAVKFIVDKFNVHPVSNVSFYVCRTNIDYAKDDRCNPINSTNGKPANLSAVAPMRIIVLRGTMADSFGENPENGYAFDYDNLHPNVTGNEMELTTQ